MGFLGGTAPASDQGNLPKIVLIGTSFDFSDHLLRLLRLSFEEVCFERLPDLSEMENWDKPPRVIILHEAVHDLPASVDLLRRSFPQTLIAIGCRNPEVLNLFNKDSEAVPVSALQMDAQVDVWFSILHLLLSGHPYVPAAGGHRVSPLYHDGFSQPSGELTQSEIDASGSENLTPREIEILPLIAEGIPNKVIASRLGLSVHTVKLHNHHILRKLGVSNRTGAANWYLSQSRVQPNDKA